MIQYDPGATGLQIVLKWKGSVFPKALIWALPNALLALLLHAYCRVDQAPGSLLNMTGFNLIWAGYTSVLGFLVVFRNNQAYTRFWEGATLLNQVRGEWFNAVSTLFAFCNQAQEHKEKVEAFQQTLIRFASMMYCAALQQVCDMEHSDLEIIDYSGIDQKSLGFMMNCNDKCEILLQWIQRLIVEADESKTVKIAPPLLTRAFQELSRGIVNLNGARKIKDIPFPFPYAQMITCMLIVHWLVTPLFASQVVDSPAVSALACFLVTFAFWCLFYIALEIDQPFGEDANDLPLQEMQKDFNQSLLNLMHPLAQQVPSFQRDGEGSVPMIRKISSIKNLETVAQPTVLEGMLQGFSRKTARPPGEEGGGSLSNNSLAGEAVEVITLPAEAHNSPPLLPPGTFAWWHSGQEMQRPEEEERQLQREAQRELREPPRAGGSPEPQASNGLGSSSEGMRKWQSVRAAVKVHQLHQGASERRQ